MSLINLSINIYKMKFKEFTQSKHFTHIIMIIGGVLIALVVFQAGVFVGFRSASFSIRWHGSRNDDVSGPNSIFAPFGRDKDDMNPHGAIGEIISIKLPSIMVKGPSGDEEVITIASSTSIRLNRDNLSPTNLKIGQHIVTIGSPDDNGQINATFIRVTGSTNLPGSSTVPLAPIKK